MFFYSEHGAYVSDVLMSIIFTAEAAGINSYEYLIAIQDNKSHVHKNPGKWLPWNYEKTVQELNLLQAA